MSSSDLTNQNCPTDAQEGTVENPPATTSLSDTSAQNDQPSNADAEASRRQILIGSQRDPAAYRARQRRDWTPVDAEKPKTPAKPKAEQAGPVASAPRGNGVGDEAKARAENPNPRF